jgi:hypothetical protein
VSTVSDLPTHRAPLPTNRGRQTQAAIDAAARTVIARKGVLATTIADIATAAGRSTPSFYTITTPKMLSSASGCCGSATRAASGRLPGMACRYGSEPTRPQLHTGSPTNIG